MTTSPYSHASSRPQRDTATMAIRQFDLASHSYVSSIATARAGRDEAKASRNEARAAATDAVRAYTLGLAARLDSAQPEFAATLRVMAAQLQGNTAITPSELSSRLDLADRLASIA